jgi:hypothetical protein
MDLERLTPVEQAARRRWWIRFWVIAAIIVLALYYLIFVNTYVVAYKDERQHFMHGSIGSEIANGLPYWIFKALPKLYEDELGPNGYRRFGFLYESADADLPIGVSRRIVSGIERVWLNCSVCHVGTWREAPGGETRYLYGAPSNNLRLYEFIQFLRRIAVDSKFNTDNLIQAINSEEVGGNLGFLQRALYRYVIVDRVREGLLGVRAQLGFLDRQHDWGPGRVDTFNPYKAIQFNFPMGPKEIDDIALNGSSDYPSIWRQRPREGMHLHWDGNNTSVAERNLSAALGAGVTPVTVDRDSIMRVQDWLWDLPPPPFPETIPIDKERAAQGRKLYADHCARCHGIGGEGGYDYDTDLHPRLGHVVGLDRIGTDRGRWASYTEDFAGAQNLLYAGYPWRFSHFRKTGGYASQPLDGIWARSPYLHNGSVPTLRDLLEPAARRPSVWFRGSDVFDFAKVGYRADGVGAAADELFRYDTSVPGNSNRGHEGPAYGTDLGAAEKDAIVEYMKTL